MYEIWRYGKIKRFKWKKDQSENLNHFMNSFLSIIIESKAEATYNNSMSEGYWRIIFKIISTYPWEPPERWELYPFSGYKEVSWLKNYHFTGKVGFCTVAFFRLDVDKIPDDCSGQHTHDPFKFLCWSADSNYLQDESSRKWKSFPKTPVLQLDLLVPYPDIANFRSVRDTHFYYS